MNRTKYLLLDINLTRRKIEKKIIPDKLIEEYIGGSGLGAYELYYNSNIYCDPFGEDNILLFLAGPLTGTFSPCSGRNAVVAKSPLTGIWGEANVGGKWGRELRKAGWLGIKIYGKASNLVYIFIDDYKVEIRDAGELAGMDTFETEKTLRGITFEDARVACIGPAGENLCRIAGIFTDGVEARVAARCGLGAIMGSKKVKAIVVHGTGKPYVYDEKGLQGYVRKIMPDFIEGTKRLRKMGTPGLVVNQERLGSFPIRNFKWDDYKDEIDNISWDRLKKTIFVKRVNCASCPVGCGRLVRVKEGKYKEREVNAGPEYETIGMLGSNLLISDLNAIQFLNQKCNRIGIDTIEAGALIGFAIEAFEKGFINTVSTNGLKLRWGDPEIASAILDNFSDNSGFGKFLSSGYKNIFESWGKDTANFAPQVKGLSFPAHDPRAYNSIAVGFATSNRGACHLQAFSHVFERVVTMPEIGIDKPMDPFSVREKGEKVALIQNIMCIFDSLSLCKFDLFGGIKLKNMAEMLTLATGLDFDFKGLLRIGERIFNLKRLYNNKCGISKADDVLPKRFLTEAKKHSLARGNLPPLDIMLNDYYKFRQWDPQGKPTKEKVIELGIKV